MGNGARVARHKRTRAEQSQRAEARQVRTNKGGYWSDVFTLAANIQKIIASPAHYSKAMKDPNVLNNLEEPNKVTKAIDDLGTVMVSLQNGMNDAYAKHKDKSGPILPQEMQLFIGLFGEYNDIAFRYQNEADPLIRIILTAIAEAEVKVTAAMKQKENLEQIADDAKKAVGQDME